MAGDIDWRKLYEGYDSTPELEAEAAARLGIEWPPKQTTSTERVRRWRARQRGELPPAIHVDKSDLYANCIRTEGGCLEWQRGRTADGYGTLKLSGVTFYAHRMSLEQKLGRAIKPKFHACHTCDNPPCIAPEHLFEGTARDNIRDRLAKGRWRIR